jgi:hypothetical protein
MTMIQCVKCDSTIDTDYNVEHTEEEDGYCENVFEIRHDKKDAVVKTGKGYTKFKFPWGEVII